MAKSNAELDADITASLYRLQRESRAAQKAERASKVERRAARYPGETDQQRFARMPKIGDRVKLYEHGTATVLDHDGFNIRVALDEGTISGSRHPWVTHLDVES